MNLLSLILLTLLAGSREPGPVSQGGNPPVVLSDLSETSHQELQAALDLAFPGTVYEFRPLDRADLMTALQGLPGDPPVGLIGYPLPLLIEAERAGLLSELHEPLPLDHEAFRQPGHLYVACWFSPLVLVRGLSSLERNELGGVDPDWLPDRLLDLGQGRFQEMLRMQAPRAWNATGVLLASLSRQTGGGRESERLLAGLDANLIRPYLSSSVVLLSRLEDTQRQLAPATLRDYRRFRGAAEGTLEASDPGGQPVVLAYGLAGLGPSGQTLQPLQEILREPDLMVRIGVHEDLIPISPRIEDAALESWMLPYRLWFEGNTGQLALDQEQAMQAVEHYQREIVGSLARKQAIFSEYFDAIGIALMAVFILWVIRHREDQARSQK